MRGKTSDQWPYGKNGRFKCQRVCLRSKWGLATETCHGRTKEITPVNQTRQTKLTWKHTGH